MTTLPPESTAISPDLLELLACPVDHSPVLLESDGLRCTECGRRFPIENGVPNMLIDDEE
jgi:uncharacterized protein YbaR (Trm112 family)